MLALYTNKCLKREKGILITFTNCIKCMSILQQETRICIVIIPEKIIFNPSVITEPYNMIISDRSYGFVKPIYLFKIFLDNFYIHI